VITNNESTVVMISDWKFYSFWFGLVGVFGLFGWLVLFELCLLMIISIPIPDVETQKEQARTIKRQRDKTKMVDVSKRKVQCE
jgi:hypothetical protein